MSNKKFITTTIPYVGHPHVGHVFEFIIGDALTRFFKNKLGANNVFYNLGVDEHGKKIYDASIAAGKPTQQFLDENAVEWKQFCTQFNIKYDSFYRTSDSKHYKQVSMFWNHCIEQNLIYKKKYTGTYCIGCESFKLEKDLINGKCPDHSTTELQIIEEENYFFALSKFKDDLLQWVDSDINLIPNNKILELRNVIVEGEDISISRKKESVPWGIPVPNDDSQVIYVWFEALQSYWNSIDYYDNSELFKEFWADSVQIFGNDNLRFQGALFQYLLKAANIPYTKTLLCHGTILDKNGHKMSKTVGNVIDPIEQLNKYGIDAIRYYALAGLQTYGDSGWSEENLVELYNSDLANGYGNLVARVVHLINLKQIDIHNAPAVDQKNDSHLFLPQLEAATACWNNYDINGALNGLRELIGSANRYIQEKEPWGKNCTNYEPTLRTLYYVLKAATRLYEPAIPNKVEEVLESLEKLEKVIIFPRIILATS